MSGAPGAGEPILLDGATGTELSRRGLDTRMPLWSARPIAEAPDVLAAVHEGWARVGCDVLTACTFRTHERSLAAGGWSGRSDELNRAAVAAARLGIERSGRTGLRVAGSLAPLEDCFRPADVPPAGELRREHERQAESLAAAGVDLILVETMNARREAEAAVRAARATGLPTWCSFVTDGRGRLLEGSPIAEAARAAEQLGCEALLVNCSPVVEIRADHAVLAASTRLPTGASGNIGHAHDVDGWRAELMLTPERFAAEMLSCRRDGASILGGCCGTQPEHLAELARALGRTGPT